MSKDIKIKPLGKKVLVKPDKVEEKTAGGLVLPPSSTEGEKPETGVVIKLGEGTVKGKKVTFDVKVGDRIYFKKYSPDEIEVDSEKYFILDSDDILAVLE
ncbi:MAG TPA: co-chaperone GroES [Candidatus Dojkabacteria bacterium]|nr:co-chaperone GroES [Candidatus Dojkabacteria bacterium]